MEGLGMGLERNEEARQDRQTEQSPRSEAQSWGLWV